MAPRPVRALFLANDGASVGHVVRSLAVARALRARAAARGFEAHPLLATTSEADALLAWSGVPSVRLPSPAAAARAGWNEYGRRRLAEATLAAVAGAFRPDLLVVDTFPSGPHLEAATLIEEIPLRVLVRRSIRSDRLGDPSARAGLDRYSLVLVPDDPGEVPAGVPGVRAVRVPPITLVPREEMLAGDEARAELGLPAGRLALISCGGGGDPGAREAIDRLTAIVRRDGRCLPVPVLGPLARGPSPIPLQRYLRAFDVALVAAGYNSAHEVASAGVPAALFARPRDFDDQIARSLRFEAAGLGVCLRSLEEPVVLAALAALEQRPPPRFAADGATAAADEILRLVAP